jgi:DNA repair exonuclease SbcCD nuclease subunit
MESLDWFLKSVKKTDSVVILGDIFDSRSSVDFKVLNDAIVFFNNLSSKCKDVHILVGNHDLYYKENDLYNVNCRFLQSKNVRIVYNTEVITIQDKACLFIPWIDTPESKAKALIQLQDKHDIVFGHMDTVGLYGAKIQDELMFELNDFGPNKNIVSGHFHKRSERGDIKYLGAFINQSFSDVGDTKGYMTFNKNGELKFIEGICPKFEYITIPNSGGFLKGFEMASEDEKEKVTHRVKGNIIKLILNEYSSENDELFKIFKGMTPLEISVSYNRVSFEEGVEGEDFAGFDSKSDIIEIISQYIDKVKHKLPEGIQPSDISELIMQKHMEFKTQE